MTISSSNRPFLRCLAALVLLAAFAACSSDSPSEPRQNPAPTPPGTSPGASTFSISVTADPPALAVASDEPTTITITVRRIDNGAAPADGTTIVVTTTLGSFGTPGSDLQQAILSLLNGQATLLLYPDTTLGTAIVQARLDTAVGQVSIPIQEDVLANFFLSFLDPNVGTPQGGDIVEIVGGGFESPVRVLFGGTVATVQSVTQSRIRVVTPPSLSPVAPGTTLPVSVQVTVDLNGENQRSDTLANAFVYAPGGTQINQPLVFSVSPATGPNEGGTRVTIVGEGFEAPVQVFFGTGGASSFNGVEATVESVTSTRIVAVTPAATGFGQGLQNSLVDVLVRNLNTGFETIRLGAFRYGSNILITAVSPNDIIFDSRAEVTIFGQGFEAPVAVDLGGLAATVLSVTGTEIRVRASVPIITGCTNISGDVSVTNIETGASATGGSFLYRASDPLITGLFDTSSGLPDNSGPEGGGDDISIEGVGFDDPVRAVFGNNAATVLSVAPDGSRVNVLTPPFTEAFETESCDDDGDGQNGTRFIPSSVDVTVTNLVTDCEDIFQRGYTYIPSDSSCQGDAAPPPPVTAQCSDGFDNDGDTFIDAADPECTGPTDNDESS